MVDIAVLIPWRTDHGQRQRVWDRIRPIWEAAGVELCVGVDDDGGPFNRARALNRAFRLSTAPVVACFDADTLPDLDRLGRIAGGPWEKLFSSTEYLSRPHTELVLLGANPWGFPPEISFPFHGSHMAVRRELWEQIGGMDEDFVGWGGEDAALENVLWAAAGPPPEVQAACRCLWHEPASKEHWPENRRLLLDRYGQQ